MARNSLAADRSVSRNAKLSQRKKLLALHTTHRPLVREGEDARGTAPPTSLDVATAADGIECPYNLETGDMIDADRSVARN